MYRACSGRGATITKGPIEMLQVGSARIYECNSIISTFVGSGDCKVGYRLMRTDIVELDYSIGTANIVYNYFFNTKCACGGVRVTKCVIGSSDHRAVTKSPGMAYWVSACNVIGTI